MVCQYHSSNFQSPVVFLEISGGVWAPFYNKINPENGSENDFVC